MSRYIDSFRLHCKYQWIPGVVGFKMRLIDAFLSLRFGERLHIRCAVYVGSEHNICGFVIRQVKYILQYMHNKIHRRNRVVVDDDTIERLEFGFGLFDDLNFRNDLEFHFLNTKDTKYTKDEGRMMKDEIILLVFSQIREPGYFFVSQFDLSRLEIFLDVLWIKRHGNRNNARL